MRLLPVEIEPARDRRRLAAYPRHDSLTRPQHRASGLASGFASISRRMVHDGGEDMQ